MRKIALIIAVLMMTVGVFAQNVPAIKQAAAPNSKTKETKTRYVDKNQNHFRQNKNKNSKSVVREKPVVKKAVNSK